MILLPDDDSTSNVLNNSKINKHLSLPRPEVCRFFLPKLNNEIEKNKQTLIDLDSNNIYDYKLLLNKNNLINNNSNKLQLKPMPFSNNLIKNESIIKLEPDNYPQVRSNSPIEFSPHSDTDIFETNLIVKNVYSVSDINQPISSTMPLKNCSKSYDNLINISKSALSIDDLNTINPFIEFCDDNVAEEFIKERKEIFQLMNNKVQEIPLNNDIVSTNSDNLTEPMIDDIDCDLSDKPFYHLMEPIIIIEPLKINNLKRSFLDENKLPKHNSDGTIIKKGRISVEEQTQPLRVVRSTRKVTTMKKEKISSSVSKRDIKWPPVVHNVDINCTTTLVDNELIYCFKCNINKSSLCNEHPVNWISNNAVDCPFVEYLVDESLSKFYKKGGGVKRNTISLTNSNISHCNTNHIKFINCNCKQNELEHIQIDLPKQFQLRESAQSEVGIWTVVKLNQGTIIGPYIGEIINYSPRSSTILSNHYKTRQHAKSETELPFLEYAFRSNWLRCINFTNLTELANLKILRYDGHIFYQTTKIINCDVELLVCNKLECGLIKTKGEPVFKSNISQRAAPNLNNNIIIPNKSLVPPQAVYLSDEDIKNLSYNGQKYNKEIIADIAKLWQLDSQITVAEAVTILRDKYPEIDEMPENYIAQLAHRLKLRHRGGSHSIIDNEMTAYMSELLIANPSMKSPEISMKLRQKFPNKPHINKLCINQVIRRYNLRPLRGMDNNVDQETVQAIVEMFSQNPRLIIKDSQKILKEKFPLKAKLDVRTIDNIVKLNYCRLKTEKTNLRVDEEIVEEIRQILSNDYQKSNDSICHLIKKKFAHKTNVTPKYMGYLIKKLALRKSSSTIKCDDSMKAVIYKLHLDNPHYPASKINRQLRILLPEKPCVSNHTINNTIRNFRMVNQSVVE